MFNNNARNFNSIHGHYKGLNGLGDTASIVGTDLPYNSCYPPNFIGPLPPGGNYCSDYNNPIFTPVDSYSTTNTVPYNAVTPFTNTLNNTAQTLMGYIAQNAPWLILATAGIFLFTTISGGRRR